jgi:glutamate synthase domain-containing protein 1/glutamate synthase domain-containing protein 3
MNNCARELLAARGRLIEGLPATREHDPIEEGGCGVVGFAASVPVKGRNIFQASVQMHNRGNGKGGGIAAATLVPGHLGVDAQTLRESYLLQIALLDPRVEGEVEKAFITPDLEISHKARIPHVDDHRDVGLEVRPPEVTRYFVRVKQDSLERFVAANSLSGLSRRAAEDEFIYQNSFKLNQRFYASMGEKQAFVMSHARDLLIFKIVGYAEQVIQYYKMEEFPAHVWIAHQRYPTKGRVWHPAGAHPFIGMNEALVHNGDFANYFSITEHLRQHNVVPQFLTDTEVSVLIFDLLHRTFGYPLEYVIEALAPTTELDFDCLPEEKKRIYRAIQATHMHASPDGPWFFIIARSAPDEGRYQLVGITDTAMLRPQVFALQEGEASIGLVASEKQAIDATLKMLSAEDPRFRPVADVYWNARGGSHTDGGSFAFTVQKGDGGAAAACTLACTDKFGKVITPPPGEWRSKSPVKKGTPVIGEALAEEILGASRSGETEEICARIASHIASWQLADLQWLLGWIRALVAGMPAVFPWALDVLMALNDRRFYCGSLKRSVVVQHIREAIEALLDGVPPLGAESPSPARRVDWQTRESLASPRDGERCLVICARGFQPEGEDCDSRVLVRAYRQGWRRFVVYGLTGQRFTGCGLGPSSGGVRIEVLGSSGDYLASGIDGLEIHVHDNGQDQLGQIMKQGTLVVHGDVGQAFMYGAKGGEVYVLGNCAGRPLINAVGRPRVVINGTCLDFLAESFMAGDPLFGGGFVVLNGVRFNHRGHVEELETPYPGANLFSMASGGAIYVRDPGGKLVADQLNGGEFAEMTDADWNLVHPYLLSNERHFGISVERDLLTVGGTLRPPQEVYRKIRPRKEKTAVAAARPQQREAVKRVS